MNEIVKTEAAAGGASQNSPPYVTKSAGRNTTEDLHGFLLRHHPGGHVRKFFESAEGVPNFLFSKEESKVPALPEASIGDYGNWYYIGDIHGDFYSLSNAVEFIKAQCSDFRLVFLGDMVDRGPHPVECIAYMVQLAREFPNRIGWIVGNHDVGITFDLATRVFQSSVSPAEFTNYLNEPLDDQGECELRRSLGLQFIKLIACLPRAIVMPDGLLVTHGGIPHTDLQREIGMAADAVPLIEWLNSAKCLEDFTWTRISRARAKIPNRTTRGCQYGYGDFKTFCETVGHVFPLKRILTGHEHPADGVDNHPEWVDYPALTLKGFGYDSHYEYLEAFRSQYQNHLVVGRHRQNALPDVIRIPVSATDLQAYFESEIVNKISEHKADEEDADIGEQ